MWNILVNHSNKLEKKGTSCCILKNETLDSILSYTSRSQGLGEPPKTKKT